MTLGFTQHEAKRAVSAIDTTDMSVEEIIKIALKEMM
jgi:Holliday junction resolvasome RuvABC DNA-binding subunit